MSGPVPLAFYAPLKPPDHPVASGDRRMARLLLAALERAGFAPQLATSLRSFEPAGDAKRQELLREQAEREAHRLIAAFRSLPGEARPRLWFTYHVYYKAPDWIGPTVARELALPYVIAEGSRAGKRARSPWALAHGGAEAALDAADAVFVLTDADRPALEAAKPARQRLVDLPPFIATGPVPERAGGRDEPQLLTVAMMRAGDKLASYRLLAAALALVKQHPWRLTIAGDGPARSDVERLFLPLAPRVRFTGLIEDEKSLAKLYAGADLFLWPAVNEAYGMALLEAQAHGCPVVAGSFGGVPSVVRDGETGVLTPPGDVPAFAAGLASLLTDPPRRQAMGEAAGAFIRRERTVEHAARIIRDALLPLVEGGTAP